MQEDQSHSGIMSIVNPNTQSRMPLRRATYIHVSDLTNAYNIDHAKLEEELMRVKENLENSAEDVAARSSNFGGVPTELDTSHPKNRLQPPRGGNNMVVLIGNVRVVVNKNRVDGSRVRLAEVEVGDETGTVSLRARDDQIDALIEISERSGAAVLRNCTLELYQGKHIRLAVTKWGKLTSYPDQVPSTPAPPSKINRERNFSLIDLTVVASEMVHTTGQHSQVKDHQSLQDSEHPLSTQGSSQRSFQSNQSMTRGRGRRNSRGRQQQVPVPSHYSDATSQVSMGHYQGNLHQHGYPSGFVADPINSAVYYQPRQPDVSQHQQHQQIMMQHQYEMQHRHQMQMYHVASSSLQESPVSYQSHSPMIASSTPSFDAGFENFSSSSEIPVPPGSNQFMMPIHGTTPQSPHLGPTNHADRAHSPLSPGKMNPQAATFDPVAGKFHRPPHS